MTISIRHIERTAEEAAAVESYLDSGVIVTSTLPSSRREVGAVCLTDSRWLRVERSLSGGATRYFASIGNSSASTAALEEGGGSMPMEAGVRTFLLPEGVSILTVSLGDYGADGRNDIVLRLSDGAFVLIEPEGGEEATAIVPPPAEEAVPFETPADAYDPEPTPSPRSNNPQQSRFSPPTGSGGHGTSGPGEESGEVTRYDPELPATPTTPREPSVNTQQRSDLERGI